ncbi:MAG: hypothetical protein NVS3B20_22850 [Polyangiales bacterium]
MFVAPLAVLLAIGSGGCLADTSTTSFVASAEQPIINGDPSVTEEDAAIGIGIFQNGSFSGFCSGVLVAENLVLTARHCVSRTVPGGIACSKDGKPLVGGGVLSEHRPEDLQILVGTSVRLKFQAKGVKIVHSDATNLCNSDLALIELDTKIAGAKLAQIRLDTPPIKGETITAVGWGVSNNSSGASRRHRKNIPVVAVGPTTVGLVGAIGDAEFAIGEGICSGDSGGPAFDDLTGAVVGVVSRGGNGAAPDPKMPSAPCVDLADRATRNIYTRTDGFKDLILSAFAEVGSEPWLEGGPDPRKAKFGEVCEGPDSCRSNLCIEAGGKRFCSSKCALDTPCPDAFTCQVAGDTSVCALPPPPPPPAVANELKKGCMVAKVGARNVSAAGTAVGERVSTVLAMGALGLGSVVRRRRASRKRVTRN